MLRGSSIAFLAILCALVCLHDSASTQPAARKKAPKTHLMWHLAPSEGATPELTTRVEKAVRALFTQRHGDVLMDGMTMDSLLLVEGNEKFLRCGTGAGCLSGLAELAGMAYVIAGEVGLRRGRTFTRLVLVDVSARKIVSRASVGSGGPPGKALMEELAVAMFTPERYRGSVKLEVTVAGATVLLDGDKVGLTPLVGPLADVPAGEHLIEVKMQGRQPFSRTVHVPMGKTVRVVAILPEVPHLQTRARPFYEDWPFWTALGVGVVAMGAAGGLHYDAGVLQDNADAYKESNHAKADEEQDRADARYLQTYVMYGIGGAGLLAAGLIAIIDVASADETDEPKKPAVELGLAPRPGGLGIFATWRF